MSQFRMDPGSLSAPGLSAPPPVSKGAAALAEIQRSLGMAARTAQDAAALNRQIEREDAELQNEHFGQGVSRAASLESEMARMVATGELLADFGSERDVAEAIAAERLDGFNQFHAEGFRKRLVPYVEGLLTERNLALRQEDIKELDRVNADAVFADPARLSSVIEKSKARWPERTENDIRGSVAVRALKIAATNADTDAFDAIAAQLEGKGFDGDIASARVSMAQRANAIESEAIQSLRSEAAGRVLDGESRASVAEWLSTQRGRGVPDHIVKNIQDDLLNEHARLNGEAHKQLLQMATQQRRQELVQRNLELGSSGLVVSMGNEVMPDGSTLTTKEMLDDVVNHEFARVDSLVPAVLEDGSLNPANIALKMESMRKFPQAVPSVWVNAWKDVPGSINPDMEPAQVDAAAVQAYRLWEHASAINSTLVNSWLDDDTAGFLRTVQAIGLSGRSGVEGAMVRAAQAASDQIGSSSIIAGTGISGSSVVKIRNSLDLDESPNGHFAEQQVIRLFKVYKGVAGRPEEQALELAIDTFKQDYVKSSNGYWHFARGQQVEDVDVGTIGDILIEMSLPNLEGESRQSLSFAPNKNGTSWTIVDGFGEPVNGIDGFEAPTLTVDDMRRVQAYLADRQSERRRIEATKQVVEARIQSARGRMGGDLNIPDRVAADVFESMRDPRGSGRASGTGVERARQQMAAYRGYIADQERLAADLAAQLESDFSASAAAAKESNPTLAAIFEFIDKATEPKPNAAAERETAFLRRMGVTE